MPAGDTNSIFTHLRAGLRAAPSERGTGSEDAGAGEVGGGDAGFLKTNGSEIAVSQSGSTL